MNDNHYHIQNQMLLDAVLAAVERQSAPAAVRDLLRMALAKSIKAQAERPSPALLIWVAAQDLGVGERPWVLPLASAGACLYAAADLFDDVQDQEPGQPVIQAAGAPQAINIANFLLMLAYQFLQALPLPAESRLALIAAFTNAGCLMSTGQFLDIHSTNLNDLSIRPEQIFPNKAGAEFALFFEAAPLALGLDPAVIAAWRALGHEFGSLLQIFTDFFDIWVPQAKKLSQDIAIHKCSFPLFWARSDQRWQAEVDRWLAGRASTGARQLQLRRLLVQTRAIEEFAAYFAAAEARVSSLLEQLGPLPRFESLWQNECDNTRKLIATLLELRAKARVTPADAGRPLVLAPALTRGLDYLTFVADYQDAWEVQRWGFLGEPLLVGNLFNPLLILESLLEAGQEIRPELSQLLARRLADGWHYYTDSAKIPPDTDDLAQILQLVGRTGLSALDAALAGPLDVLAANIADLGFCPTWLCDGVNHRREEVDKKWFGNVCPGVMANLYYGLAHYSQHLNLMQSPTAGQYQSLLDQGVAYLIGAFDAEQRTWHAVHYPSHLYVAYLMARLFALVGQQPACLAVMAERVLSEQSLDGGWFQQPQATACALLFLQALPPALQAQSRQARQKALFYLLDAQDYDGSWPGAPLFVRPGRDGAYETFAHAKLATAFVLRALARHHAAQNQEDNAA